MSAESRRWLPTGSPARWCITSPAIRAVIRPDWPRPSTSSSPIVRKRNATARRDAGAASKSSPGPTSPSRPWRSIGRCVRKPRTSVRRQASAGARDALKLVTESSGFVGRQLDDQSTASFKWYPHHDAAPLLRCFQRTVSGPGLHGRHRVLPPDSSWPAPADLVGTEHAPPANLEPCSASNCVVTPPIVPYPGHHLCKDPHLCGQWADAGTQQPRIWSSTIPVACISAYAVVGPTKRNPRRLSSRAMAFDSSVAEGIWDGSAGRDRGDGANDHSRSARAAGVPSSAAARALAIVASILAWLRTIP